MYVGEVDMVRQIKKTYLKDTEAQKYLSDF